MTPPPRTVGRYEIRHELGRGMMGVVYEALDPALGRVVALKTINPVYVTNPADREAFERRFAAEAGIAGRLSHPGIVVVHDVGRDEASGLLFIAFERLPGETLAALLARGLRPSWRETLEISRCVAESLQHAHEQGVVHRDIKPANIMLLPAGRPKVMDFGIAKLEAAHLTAAGQFFGTPLYMSPEQALSLPLDARSDIFSLGSVTYVLLTGRQAFEAESVLRILGRVIQHDPVAPTQLDPALPTDVDYLMARALAKSPDDRYPTVGLLAEDIQDILAGSPPRHRAGWVPPRARSSSEPEPTLFVETGPGAFLPTITVGPHGGGGDVLPPLPRVLAAGRTWSERWTMPVVLVLAIALVMAGLVWGVRAPVAPTASPEAQTTPAPTPLPTPEPSPTVAPPEPTPSPSPPAKARARVVVDFEHPLETGGLRVWLDGEELIVERLKGEVTKNLVLFKLRGGVQTEVLDVSAGRHLFKVEVSWGDDQQRTQEMRGYFLPGETYRLVVRLGRVKKDLSLRWTR